MTALLPLQVAHKLVKNVCGRVLFCVPFLGVTGSPTGIGLLGGTGSLGEIGSPGSTGSPEGTDSPEGTGSDSPVP